MPKRVGELFEIGVVGRAAVKGPSEAFVANEGLERNGMAAHDFGGLLPGQSVKRKIGGLQPALCKLLSNN
jgi:hypothetical protein